MDAIYLEGLSFFAYHGLHAEEARLGQRFHIDLTCWLDLSKPGQSDAYDDTLCYGALAKTVEAAVTGHRFNLIERLATEIIETVFASDKRIQKIQVRVQKPSAPLPINAGMVSVELVRDRTQAFKPE